LNFEICLYGGGGESDLTSACSFLQFFVLCLPQKEMDEMCSPKRRYHPTYLYDASSERANRDPRRRTGAPASSDVDPDADG
jgi:hypothetical protein